MTFPTLGWVQTGIASQKLVRGAQGAYIGRPMAIFAGGINPTTHGGSHGVIGDGDLNVTIGSGLQLNVSTGHCFISGTSSIDQGSYYGYNPTTASVTLDAHEANPRYDLVVVRARDTLEDASGSTDIICTFKKGTASGTPAPPSPDSGSLVIAQVLVPATSGAVTIDTTMKPYAAGLGGVQRIRSTTRPTGAAVREGSLYFERDTQKLLLQVAAGIRGLSPLFQRATYTPTVAGINLGTGGSASNSAQYLWVGGTEVGEYGLMFLQGRMIVGTSGFSGPSSTLSVDLPSGFEIDRFPTAGGADLNVGQVTIRDNSPAAALLGPVWAIDTNSLRLLAVESDGTYAETVATGAGIPITIASNDSITWTATIAAYRV